ncbi:MAG: hypothetical protein GQ559_11570 [Desulfobulbaceae bacterium]|nr:hypothetical protein [Desulfobulbaceae bacterium]
MINHIWSIACLRVITDKRTGLTSYIDTIDSVGVAPGKEIILPPFILASKWSRTDKAKDTVHFEVNISLKGPSDKRKKQLQLVHSELAPGQKGIFLQLEVKGLKLSETGEWFIHVSWRTEKERWKKVASIPLNVQLRDEGAEKP